MTLKPLTATPCYGCVHFINNREKYSCVLFKRAVNPFQVNLCTAKIVEQEEK